MALHSAFHHSLTYNSFARRHQWPNTLHSTTSSLPTQLRGATNGHTPRIPLMFTYNSLARRHQWPHTPHTTTGSPSRLVLTIVSQSRDHGPTISLYKMANYSRSPIYNSQVPLAVLPSQQLAHLPLLLAPVSFVHATTGIRITLYILGWPMPCHASIGLCHVMPPLAYAMSCLHTPLTFPCDQTRGLKSTRNAVVAVYHIPYGVVYLRSAAWCRGHRPTPRGSHRVIPHDELGCV